MTISYYEAVRADRDRELRAYEAQTDAWLKAKREGGMLPDFAGGMAASLHGCNIFGGSGSRDMQSYSMFRQWIFCAVNFIAKRMAGQPWSAGELTNAKRDDKKPPKKSHKLSLRQPWMKHTVAKSLLRRNAPNQDLDVFQSHAILDCIDRPNPLQRRSEFMYMSVASLLLTGVCYWVGGKVAGKKSPNDKQAEGDKIELWAIPSHLVEPLHKDGLFSNYKIKMSAQDMEGQEIPVANVARTYIPDPSDIMGVFSPLNACIRAIRTDDHVQGSQEGLFARGLMPHVGVVIGEAATQQFAPILTGPQRHQIERMIVELYNRTTNDGMPAIFDGMIKDIRRLDPMPREMDWKVSGEIVRDRILRAYGISLLLLGDTQGGNRAQAVMAEENAAANVFNPLADTFTETACDWLAPMFEAENSTGRIWAWMNPFVAHDEEMTSRQWSEARKNGDVDRNEYRAERLGLPPREDEIQKSALVETVGGVQGAIAVSNAVGQGVLEPEQAAVIFQQFFGLDEKVAKQLAGEKKPQPPAPGPGAPGQPPFGAPAAAPEEKPSAGEEQPAAEEAEAIEPAEKAFTVKSIPSKYDHLNFSVTDAMVTAAKQGLAWREEFNRGGTQVGVARANQIINDKTLTPDTWRRVKAYFDRHEVDKQGEGWNQGEPGYPSAGKIAWYIWGSDAGWSRAKKIVAQMNAADEEEAAPDGRKYSEDQPRDDHGRFGSGGGGTSEKPAGRGRKVKEQTESPKTKSEIAKASATRVDKEIQRYSEEHNEPQLAKALGGESLPDNEPIDVLTDIDGKTHGIELKTMVVNKASKLTMKKEAQDRKRAWERKHPGRCHTVVFDDRAVFNAKGPGKHDESQRKILYRRGFGSFRTDKMYEVKGGMKELKELLSMDKRKLPKGARAADEGGAS